MIDLYWHCANCGDHEPVHDTGDGAQYVAGDAEKCTNCGDGFAVVMTLRDAARIEQRHALRASKALAGGDGR